MPRLKKKEESTTPTDTILTLTAGRSRRTIKPNRKYLNDSVVLATASKTSSRSSSSESDASEDEYKHAEEEDEEVIPKLNAGRKSIVSSVGPKKPLSGGSTPSTTIQTKRRGRPPKNSGITKTEPVKNLRQVVMKRMDLSMLSLSKLSKARVVLTPISNRDIKRKLELDESIEKVSAPVTKEKEKVLEKPKPRIIIKSKEPEKLKNEEVSQKLEKPYKVERLEKMDKPEKYNKNDKNKVIKTTTVDKVAVGKLKEDQDKKQEIRVIRKKPLEDLSSNVLKKVINPVAVKRQLVEKSILDKRAKKTEDSAHSTDEEDDVEVVNVSREPITAAIRKRKSPLVIKHISPLVRKIEKPSFSKTVTVSSIGQKRKVSYSDDDSDEKTSKVNKKIRTIKTIKSSVKKDSDFEDETDSDSYDERLKQARRLLDNKSSVMQLHKAKESMVTTRILKASDIKTSLTKSISLNALDKSKHLRTFGSKIVQTSTKTPGLLKPVAQSTPKPGPGLLSEKKSKSELNLVDPIHSPENESKRSDIHEPKHATIRIVDIGDIIKQKSNSTPDVRKVGTNRSSVEDDDDSSDSVDSFGESKPMRKSSSAEKPKTNNQLVQSILERKRPINLDHLRANRPVKRGRPSNINTKIPPADKVTPKTAQQSVINLTEDEIDFEDMLQTNIVTANKVQKVMEPKLLRERRRLSPTGSSDENSLINSSLGTRTTNRHSTASDAKTSSNNNNVYKSNNNGRFGQTTSISRSSSSSPQKNPPRILNATMKLGDTRPHAKLVTDSGKKHYSIDLTDPDNNVTLIASPDSPPQSPVKRSPMKAVIPRPIVSSTGLRNSNAANKPIAGAVQRSLNSFTSSSGSSPKMKKITCYETWYVINIPNNENKPEKSSFAMSMIGLGNEAANIQLPSTDWSHKIILTKRKTPPSEGEEIFSGEVEDRAINEEDKRNYEPCNIMFRRRTATPGKFNLQYDRAVIFRNDSFFINVDGKNCQLVGAPSKLDGPEDIETLLAVVDFVNLKNACVELSSG